MGSYAEKVKSKALMELMNLKNDFAKEKRFSRETKNYIGGCFSYFESENSSK